jgi:Uma2 family endonuclease
MKIRVVDEEEKLIRQPYLLRLGGWTVEQYLREAPEDLIWEFVRGEVIMHSPATAEHQRLVKFLVRLLDGYCEIKGCGEVLTGPAAVRILPDVIREPDIFVIAKEDVLRAKGVPLDVLPVLVVEVVSPSTRTLDLREKAEDYALSGIPEYWAVDMEQKALFLHRLKGKKYEVKKVERGRVKSSTIPGFFIEVDWLFSEPLPPADKCLQMILRGEL